MTDWEKLASDCEKKVGAMTHAEWKFDPLLSAIAALCRAEGKRQEQKKDKS